MKLSVVKLFTAALFLVCGFVVTIALCIMTLFGVTGNIESLGAIFDPVNTQQNIIAVATNRNVFIPADAENVQTFRRHGYDHVYLRFDVTSNGLVYLLAPLCFDAISIDANQQTVGDANPFHGNDFCGGHCPDWWTPSSPDYVGDTCEIAAHNVTYRTAISRQQPHMVFLYVYSPSR